MVGKKYEHKEVEQNRYAFWLEKDYFKAGDLTKKPFCIVMPPPNVTGRLHLGHALDTTIQDVVIRYKRMDGYDALWLPGMDHAGIATQAKVDQRLSKEGINPREMSREDWLNHAWGWKEEYASFIRSQWAKLGLSPDYSRERFTMDDGCNKAVNKVFIDLYNKGIIYRGKRIINWDPEAMTALSNMEVIHKEVKGALYYLKYMINNSEEYIEIATTRPETIFGDTAIAVNSKDKRYKNLIGKEVLIPIINKKIKIITDDYADMTFGTGAVKITPAHDPNDYEVGIRNTLEQVICIDENGKMNENAFMYKNLDRFECRKQLVKDLKDKLLLIKTEEITHSVGHSERTDAIVEPYLSNQWFVNMENLAKTSIEAQKTNKKVNFIPKRFEKIYLNWMEETMDWCISRQLWWGHQIPAWYKGDQIYVGDNAPDDTWIRDEDVLDTWFSSALWPFSTLGWPQAFDDRYFPNNLLVTGYDIIFFWVSRMIFQSLEFTNQKPFDEVLIHGIVRAEDGRKMSKSLGNGIDPMDVIDQYGADSLRYFLVSNTAPGQDLRYDLEKVKATWNFINKIWNASRYVILNLEGFNKEDYTFENLDAKDKWILTKANETIKNVRKYMEKYEFNNAATYLYNFIWNDYCDWYIELSKIDMSNTNKTVLLKVLTDILKMMHPFTPYVTEEIYQMLPIKEESIMISSYPIYEKHYVFNEDKKEIDELIKIIKAIRSAKIDYNFKEYYIEKSSIINKNKQVLFKLLKLDSNNIVDKIDFNLKTIELPIINIKIGYLTNINEDQLKESLLKEKEMLIQSITRRENLLNNEKYVNKAPQNIVLEDKKKLIDEKEKLNNINKQLNK